MPTQEIPNLWPAELGDTGVLTPTSILKAQAAELARFTHGLLRGEVIASDARPKSHVFLDVVAPALNERRRLIDVSFERGQPYPCWIDGGAPSQEILSEQGF